MFVSVFCNAIFHELLLIPESALEMNNHGSENFIIEGGRGGGGGGGGRDGEFPLTRIKGKTKHKIIRKWLLLES